MLEKCKIFWSSKIKDIRAYEVIDSRGLPTVACIVKTWNGAIGKAMVPSGASTGEREALELRDGDKKRYGGKGVLKAVDNVNRLIAPQLVGMNCKKQAIIDKKLNEIDGTESKSKLGANATLAVSLACAKAAACSKKMELYEYIRTLVPAFKDVVGFKLPVPMLNVINGGAHADNTIDFQEFMFMPVGATSFRKAIQMASECFHELQKILKSKKMNTSKGDEGGFAPNLKSAEEALDVMLEAIKAAGYKAGINADIAIALDSACSELYDDSKHYVFQKAINAGILSKQQATKTTDQMIEYWVSLVKKYPIISIEDGLAENDWEGWSKLVKALGNKVQIVGDDIFCTNPKIAKEGIERNVANAVLIKVNQIGTLSETIDTIMLAKQANWCNVISHRSGETEDTTIADLAVALNAGQIKTGSMSRSERIAKYNRLMEIEDQLSVNGSYDGVKTFTNLKM